MRLCINLKKKEKLMIAVKKDIYSMIAHWCQIHQICLLRESHENNDLLKCLSIICTSNSAKYTAVFGSYFNDNLSVSPNFEHIQNLKVDKSTFL